MYSGPNSDALRLLMSRKTHVKTLLDPRGLLLRDFPCLRLSALLHVFSLLKNPLPLSATSYVCLPSLSKVTKLVLLWLKKAYGMHLGDAGLRILKFVLLLASTFVFWRFALCDSIRTFPQAD